MTSDAPATADREPASPRGTGSYGGGTRTETSRIPPWLPRAVFITLLSIAGFLLAAWVLGRLRDLIVLLVVSLFLSLAIEPAVNILARRGMRRGAATGLVFLVLVLVTIAFSVALGSVMVNQVANLADNVPEYVEGTIAWGNDTFGLDLSIRDIQERIAGSGWENYASRAANNAVGLGTTVVGSIFSVFTVGLFTFYLSAEGPAFRRSVTSLFPPAKQGEVLRAWEIAITKTGGYIYSRALMGLCSFVFHYAFFRLISLPYAFALALWVGVVSQFIPTVGTYLAGALPIIVALTNDPIDALWILAFIAAYQQFENYIIQPRITSRTVDIHPAVAFGAVIAGAALLGGVGALIAIPVTAAVQAFLVTYVRRYEVIDHPGEGVVNLIGEPSSGEPTDEVTRSAMHEDAKEIARSKQDGASTS
jgi:predicted PurR-regulated permease PerM